MGGGKCCGQYLMVTALSAASSFSHFSSAPTWPLLRLQFLQEVSILSSMVLSMGCNVNICCGTWSTCSFSFSPWCSCCSFLLILSIPLCPCVIFCPFLIFFSQRCPIHGWEAQPCPLMCLLKPQKSDQAASHCQHWGSFTQYKVVYLSALLKYYFNSVLMYKHAA